MLVRKPIQYFREEAPVLNIWLDSRASKGEKVFALQENLTCLYKDILNILLDVLLFWVRCNLTDSIVYNTREAGDINHYAYSSILRLNPTEPDTILVNSLLHINYVNL